jgi:hypothetical protein
MMVIDLCHFANIFASIIGNVDNVANKFKNSEEHMFFPLI